MGKIAFQSVRVILDLFMLSFAYWLAFMLRFELDPNLQTYKLLFFTWPYVIVFKYILLILFGVPALSWRYIGIKETTKILWALSLATGFLVLLRLLLVHSGGYYRFVVIPLGILGTDFFLAFLGLVGIRVIRRISAERKERDALKGKALARKRTLLIGAGRAGVAVAREVAQNPHLGIDVVGFIDDDRMKIGSVIQGHRVLGDTSKISDFIEKHGVEQAVITIASAPGKAIRRIVNICKEIELPVKIVPGIYEILEGKVNLTRMREVTIEDLLGRDAVKLDNQAIGKFLTGKRVLVTGAGGSIGSELCRQVRRFLPEQLILVEQAENSLFSIHKELSETWPGLSTVPVIADICDSRRVNSIFETFRPHVVFHAAAHKHVPMMEWNPGEAIKNNVFGTKKVADAADRYNAQAFVMISTDKAVNPTSVMGCSKRMAEIYVQGLSRRSKTSFVAVRFGNVLGSAGSVIPIFKQQIANGGPVTVTHAEMKRYFMTIPEACQLVMQAATMGKGGEIFVLDMGEPVKIVDLARDLIRLSGFSEDEVPIKYTGVRPGEKLFEELSTVGEDMTKTRHPKIFIGKIEPHLREKIDAALLALAEVTDRNSLNEVRSTFNRFIPEMLAMATDATTLLSENPPSPSQTLH